MMLGHHGRWDARKKRLLDTWPLTSGFRIHMARPVSECSRARSHWRGRPPARFVTSWITTDLGPNAVEGHLTPGAETALAAHKNCSGNCRCAVDNVQMNVMITFK